MVRIRGMLLRLLDIMELPPNPLDQLTDLMGGEDMVAEMTGRKGLMKRDADGSVNWHRRCPEVTHCLWPSFSSWMQVQYDSGKRCIAVSEIKEVNTPNWHVDHLSTI